MTTTSLHLTELADLEAWKAIQTRIMAATGLRMGLWTAEPERLLPEPLLPPACQYVQMDKSRRERCEQFHRSVRSDVQRRRSASCQTCPFGIQYMAVPLTGDGVMAGHWEGGFVAVPGPARVPDASLDPSTWLSALAQTPHRNETEIWAALELLELLWNQVVGCQAQRGRRRAQVLQLVGHEVSRTLDASRSLDATFERFVYMVTQALGAPIGVLLLIERVSGDLVVRASTGLGPEAIPNTRARLGEGVAGRVLESGEAVVSNDVPSDPRFQFQHAPFATVQSIIGMPVRLNREIVGVLDIASYAPQAFSDDDVTLVRDLVALVEGVLAYDAAVAIPAADMDAITISLKAVTASMRHELGTDSLLEQIMDLITKVLRTATGAIWLLDGQELRVKCSRGLDRVSEPVRMGDGVVGWVAQTGEPLYVPILGVDSRYVQVREDLRSELAVPLLADGKVIGVIDVGSIHHHFFSEDEIQILTILASLAVLALRAERASV